MEAAETVIDHIEINGARLAYECEGGGERNLLFVHGYLTRATAGRYRALKDHLARSFRLFSLDMRAHGGSAAVQEGVTLDQLADDLTAFVDRMGLDRPFYVGHSMGGFLGLSAAARAPALFRALALIAPSRSRGLPVTGEQADIFVAARSDITAFDAFNRAMFVREPPEALLEQMRTDSRLVSDAVHERWVREEWPRSDIGRSIAKLDLPVLFLNGGRDILVDPAAQHADAMSMARAKEVVFTDEGHMMPMEAPARCAREIIRFFGDLETPL